MPTRNYFTSIQSNEYFVVLRKIDEEYSECYKFANRVDKISNSIINHYLSRNENVSIKDFIFSRVYEGLFDKDTLDEARAEYNENRIKKLKLLKSRNEFSGVVIGQDEKEYSIEASIKGSEIFLSCSCPLGGECEHLCAAFDEYVIKNDQYGHYIESIRSSLSNPTYWGKQERKKRKERLKARYDEAKIKEEEAKAKEEEKKAIEEKPALRAMFREMEALKAQLKERDEQLKERDEELIRLHRIRDSKQYRCEVLCWVKDIGELYPEQRTKKVIVEARSEAEAINAAMNMVSSSIRVVKVDEI